MSKRRATRDQRCIYCKINTRWCFCDRIQKKEIKTHVSMIMHHRERFLTSNTAHLTSRLLNKCDLHMRGHKDIEFNFQSLSGFTPLYLFPHENAQVLDKDYIKKISGPIQLIVPDGSWRQAKKFHRREETLKDLPCIKLEGDFKSEYTLRSQINDHGLCTIEAIAYALRIIEGEEVFDHLMDAFRVMNERVDISRHSEKWQDDYQF